MRLVEALISALMVAGLYATMSYGLALIYGVMKIINLANAGSMMLASFTTLFLWQTFGLDPLFAVVIVAPELFLRRTYLGRAIRALAQDRDACRLAGIDVGRVSMIAFGIGTALAGAAGALLTAVFPFDPSNPYGVLQLKSFTIIVLGGLESIPGVAAASFVLAAAENLTVTVSKPQLENL